MRSIFAKILYLLEKRVDLMLVTIVSHAGSAPRGTGSQMLVSHRGRVLGTIGGGTAELEAEKRAVRMLEEKRSGLHEYVLRKNSAEDIGSVCGGDITVHFQYIAGDDQAWSLLAGELLERIAQKQKGWLILRLDGGAPALLDERSAVICGDVSDSAKVLCGEGSMVNEMFFSMLLPIGERAVVFGAGHCARALVPILASVGFRVVVFDNRPEYAQARDFPQAEQVICGGFERISDRIALQENDYVVVMTSGHSYDFCVQEQVLRSPLAYCGVIGSRSKTASVNAKLRTCGVSEEAISGVHTPIGMSIKAVTPEEIAVSIAGEMILIRAQYREQAGLFTKACPMH